MPAASQSLLSAEWINERVANVLRRIDILIERLLYDGLLSSGYLPLEVPPTKELLRRMQPEQLASFVSSLPDPEQRLQVLKALDIPVQDIYNSLVEVEE